jgi:hypothetical protein
MSTTPIRPSKESEGDEEIRRILAERDATFDEEPREPWQKVKADLLKPTAPR